MPRTTRNAGAPARARWSSGSQGRPSRGGPARRRQARGRRNRSGTGTWVRRSGRQSGRGARWASPSRRDPGQRTRWPGWPGRHPAARGEKGRGGVVGQAQGVLAGVRGWPRSARRERRRGGAGDGGAVSRAVSALSALGSPKKRSRSGPVLALLAAAGAGVAALANRDKLRGARGGSSDGEGPPQPAEVPAPEPSVEASKQSTPGTNRPQAGPTVA
jgi:hypothetical protein